MYNVPIRHHSFFIVARSHDKTPLPLGIYSELLYHPVKLSEREYFRPMSGPVLVDGRVGIKPSHFTEVDDFCEESCLYPQPPYGNPELARPIISAIMEGQPITPWLIDASVLGRGLVPAAIVIDGRVVKTFDTVNNPAQAYVEYVHHVMTKGLFMGMKNGVGFILESV